MGRRRGMGAVLLMASVAPLLVLLLCPSPALAADPCQGFATGLFVDQLISAEPAADVVAPRPNYRIKLGLTLGNMGADWLNLQGLRVPVAFSRQVRSDSGDAWTKANPEDFIVSCWTMEKVRTQRDSPCRVSHIVTRPDRLTRVQVDATGAVTEAPSCASVGVAAVTGNAITFTINSATYLCPGCGLRGANGDAFIIIQHKNTLTLDRDSLQPLALSCNGHPAPIAMGQAEEPDRGALPQALARMHPACAPWFAAQDTGAVRPVAAPQSALASLTITTNTSFVYQQVPSLPAGQAPVEVLLSLTVTNTGGRAISLLGVKVPLSFSPRVMVPTQPPRWAAAYPEQFFVDCWGGQVTTSSGQRPPNDGNACQYVSLVAGANGMDLTFAGGSLCPGCTLAGFGGPMFDVKQMNYSPLDLGTRPLLQPIAPTTATIPPAPPVMCGIVGGISTLGTSPAAPVRPRRSSCPSKADFNGAAYCLHHRPHFGHSDAPASLHAASLGVLAYPASPPGYVVEQDSTNWFTFDTELRLTGAGLTNGAAKALDLRFLRLEFTFDFRVYSGPATGWLRRPPSEFGWTCWFIQSVGPVMDGNNLCNATVVTVMAPDNAEEVYGTPDDDGAPAKIVFTFTSAAGKLCSGCTLVGGQGGVFGSYHHAFFMPLNPTGLVLTGMSCTDTTTGGSISYDPPAPSPPPAPMPPPSPPPPNPPMPPRAQIPTWFGTGSADSSSGRTAQTLSTSSSMGSSSNAGAGAGAGATACPWWRANQCANGAPAASPQG